MNNKFDMDETVIFSAPNSANSAVNLSTIGRMKKQKSSVQLQGKQSSSSGWSLTGSLQRSTTGLSDGVKVTKSQTAITDSRKMSEDSVVSASIVQQKRDSVSAAANQKYQQRRGSALSVINEIAPMGIAISRTGESEIVATPVKQSSKQKSKPGKLLKLIRRAWKSMRPPNAVQPLLHDPLEKHLVHDSDGVLVLEFKWHQSSVFRIDPRMQMRWSDLTILAPLTQMPYTTEIDVIKKPKMNVFIGSINSSVSKYLITRHRLAPDQRVYVQVFSSYMQFVKTLSVLSLFQSPFSLEFVPKIMGFSMPVASTKFLDYVHEEASESLNFKWSISTPIYPLTIRELVSRVWRNMREREMIPTIVTNTFRLLKQLITAISELHLDGVYHNSLTPDNIRLQMDDKDSIWNICIYDFQNAYLHGTNPDLLSFSGIDELYIAPELSASATDSTSAAVKLSPKPDIYSFGMLAYYIIERENPFTELSYDNAIMFLKMGGARPEWKSSHLLLGQVMGDEKYPQLIETIEACWSEDPEYRPTVEYVKTSIESCCVISSAVADTVFVAEQGLGGQLSLKPQLMKRLR